MCIHMSRNVYVQTHIHALLELKTRPAVKLRMSILGYSMLWLSSHGMST